MTDMPGDDTAEPNRWREFVQTIGDLKAWLADHPDLSDNTPIILEKDAEGNSYSPLSAIYVGWYTSTSTNYGDVHSDDYVTTAEEAATDADVQEWVQQGDLYQIGDGDTQCLVLGPLN